MDHENNVFAKNLIFYRKQKELLQRELAMAVDVSTSAVSNWESGINYPRLDTVYKICEVLEISVSQLLGIDDSPYDSNDQALLAAYKKHPAMQSAVRKLLGME